MNHKNKIEKILDVLKVELSMVNKAILDFAVDKSELIQKITHHLIGSGGKRIRPILLILSAKMCGKKFDDDIINLAAAIELIHSATLLHDDVVDVSEIRRGKKTANAIWDNKPTILVGDYLFSVAFQLMVRAKNLRTLDLLAKTSSIMADGEVMQLENSSNINISQEKYLEIIFGKTSVLFSAATEVAAIINDNGENEILALKNFGKNLGNIFQIIDDILDYTAQEKILGKDVGNDFFEGKVTIPIICAYKNANKEEKSIIKNLLEQNLISAQKNQNDFLQICDLINKNRGFEDSFALAKHYHEEAIKNIAIFSDSIYKNYLLEILDYSFERKS